MKLQSSGKIILIGHTGFVGSVCYQFLKAKLGSRVMGVSSAQADLTKPSSVKKLTRLFDKNATVVFIAAITREERDDFSAFKDNMAMITHVAQALDEKNVKQFVYLSTVSVFGPMLKKGVVTENTPPVPDSFYTLAKFNGEVVFSQLCKLRGIPALILRMPRVYGAYDLKAKYGPSYFVRSAVKHKKVAIFGDGCEKRAFVFVEDVVRFLLIIFKKTRTGTFNFVADQSRSYQAAVDSIIKASKSSVQLENLTRVAPAHDENFDNQLLKKNFKQFSFTSLEKGVTRAYHQLLEDYGRS